MTSVGSDRMFDICRRVLICVFLSFRIIKSAVIFNFIGESNLSLYILAGLSVMLLAWDVFTKRRVFQGKYVFWLIMFITVCVISSLINIKYGFTKNIYIIIFMAVHMLLLYSSISIQGLERIKKDISVYGHLITALFTVLVVIMDVLYLFNFQYTATDTVMEHTISQGYMVGSGRAWGVFEYPAIMIISVAVIAFCIYFIYRNKNVLARIAYSVAIFFNLMAIILSGARSAQYALYVFIFIFPLLALKRRFDRIDTKMLIMKLGLSILFLAAVFGLIKGFQLALPYAQSAVCSTVSGKTYYKMMCGLQNVYRQSNYEISFVNTTEHVDAETGEIYVELEDVDIEEFQRNGIGSSGDITTGRMPLWKDGIVMFFDAPILGTSPGNMMLYAEEHFPESSIVEHKMEVHNSYLDVFVKTGILGAIAIGAFLILIMIYIAKYFMRKHEHMCMAGCFLSVVIALLVYMLVESDTFMIIRIQANIFWLLLGFVVAIIGADRAEEAKRAESVINTEKMPVADVKDALIK